MKDNYINVVFVVDESGSMYLSCDDVVGGFKRIVDEQKSVEKGKCTISLFTFADDVKEVYIGADVKDIDTIDYSPSGLTAMNDGIGTAIDRVGKWLAEMDESERPSKNLVVIMTDGQENFSTDYTLSQVKEMIKHQSEKYSWEFIYIGMDITEATDADNLGIDTRSFSSRKNVFKNYDMVSCATTAYRCSDASVAPYILKKCVDMMSSEITKEYEDEIGKEID